MLTLDVEQQSLRYDTVPSCCFVCYNNGNSRDKDKRTITSRLPALASPHWSILNFNVVIPSPPHAQIINQFKSILHTLQ